MPLVAEMEEDRDPDWPKCRYRSFFNTGKTTLRVCGNLDAKQEYRLGNPEDDGTVGSFIRSLEVGELPGSYVCRGCPYIKEE